MENDGSVMIQFYFFLALLSPALLIGSPVPNFPFIYVDGEAEVEVLTTYADISLKIEISAESSLEGEKRFLASNRRVLEILKKYDQSPRALSGLSKQRGSEFVFRQTFGVKVEDIKKYSLLAQELLKSEDVSEYKVKFGNRETESTKQRLRIAAIKSAKLKAEGMAKAIGARLKCAHSVTEHEFITLENLMGGSPALSASAPAAGLSSIYDPPKKMTLYMKMFVLYHIQEGGLEHQH